MSNSSISSLNNITNDVKKYTNDFSFVDILASFVGNSRFKEGYVQLKQGNRNTKTYLWEALSAVGGDIGETIYSNVLNYIDNISNVDLCKVTSLRSILNMYGVSQSLLDFIDVVPLEIRNMIDVLSINKKYLLKSGILKTELLDDIRNVVAKKNYTDEQIAQQYYAKIRNNFIIDNTYSKSGIEDTYILSNDYALSSYDCHVDDKLSINICKNYIQQNTISSIITSSSVDDELCAIQYRSNELDKFNIITDDIFIDEHFYGVFSNLCTVHYLSAESGIHELLECTKSLIGLVYDLEKFVNATISDKRRYGQLFSNLSLNSLFDHFYNETEYSDCMQIEHDLLVYDELREENFEELRPLTTGHVYAIIDRLISELHKDELKSIVNLIAYSDTESRRQHIESIKALIDSCKKPLVKAMYAIKLLSSITDYDFVYSLLNNTTTDFKYVLQKTIAFNNRSIDDADFYNYLSSMFYIALSDVCDMHYNTTSEQYKNPIRSYISTDLLISYKQQNISSETRFLKLKNGIDLSFVEKQIVDDIEKGLDSFDKYDGIRLELIQAEYDRRHTTLDKTVGELTTRASYYREQKVKEYFKFIENKFYGSHENMLSSAYILNDSYIEVDQANNKYQYLLNTDGITINTRLIDFVANDLAKLTLYISRLRENIKIQALKYYMKGTFNLLSYVINEYLIEFSRLNYRLNTISNDTDPEISSYTDSEISAILEVKNRLSTHMFDDVEIVEYDDITEYYNLSTSTTHDARNARSANKAYWTDLKNDKFSSIASSIDSFYLNTLKCKDKITDVDKFLSTLFNIGADTSYIDNELSTIDVADTTEMSAFHFKNFIKWNGLDVGYEPYYNHKNITHSSYQIHPNLHKFVESAKLLYTIDNAFNNGIANEILSTLAVENLKTNVGKFGQVIDLWKNNAFDFSGYKTSYELGLHQSKANTNQLVEIADYDGAFYPPAVDAYINDKTNFIQSVKNRQTTKDRSSYYERFYMHLGLSDADLQYIVNQLETYEEHTKTYYYNKIRDIVSAKDKKSAVYDIYKYATDRYGNTYILYKNYSKDVRPYPEYDESNPTYTDKENTLGELWIRLKDHPIAFPAFTGRYPNVNVNAKNSNGKIRYLSQKVIEDQNGDDILVDDMKYFYDFEFDSTKRTLLLNSYPINNPNYASIREHEIFYKKILHSDVILCNVGIEQNVVTRKSSLTMCEDTLQRIDTLENNNLLGRKVTSGLSSIQSFIGYYKTTSMIAGVYVDKYFDLNGLERGLGSFGLDDGIERLDSKVLDVSLSKYVWHSSESTETSRCKLSLIDHGYDKYSFASPTVRFNYNADILSFTTLTFHDGNRQCTNFVGHNTDVNSNTTYPNATSGYVIDLAAIKQTNSFDSFDKYITTIDTRFIGNSLYSTNVDIFNLNSDASYIPQYAGEAGKNELWLTNKYKDQQYHAIELLGWSNNIDKAIDSVDPNRGVNTDIRQLEDMIPGRVYEDFSTYDEKLIYVESNPAMYTNCIGRDFGDRFEWSFDMKKFFASDAQLSCIDLIVYNNSSATKTAYYVGSVALLIEALKSGKRIYAENYISSDTISDVRISTDVVTAKIAGTFNYFDNPVNVADTCHIDNIKSIEISYNSDLNSDERILTLRFYKNDKDRTSYIQSKSIKIAMYNKYNLKMYEYYHFLDERGVVDNDYPLSEYKTNPELIGIEPSAYSFVMLSDLHDDKFNAIAYEDVSALISSIIEPDNQKIYLKNMSIVDKNYLSDILVFRGYDNIAFKYSDEDVYNSTDSRFYYPGHNMLYPTLDASLFGLQMSSYSLSDLFTLSNIYIFQSENSKTFADKVGDVDINVLFNETECLRVFEEYDERYGAENPSILSCVHFTTSEDTKVYDETTISGHTYIDVNDIHAENYQIDEVLQQLTYVGYKHENTESLSSDFEFEKITLNVCSDNTDFNNLLNIYVNYKVDKDGIVLYFNYYNYINTPYIAYDEIDGKFKPQTVDGTYLKLNPGEDGLLDVTTQFKAMYGDNIYGIKEGKLLTYKIFNVSDDKPKFVFYKMFEIKKNSLCQDAIKGDTTIVIKNVYVNLDDDSVSRTDRIFFKQRINITSVETIKPGMTFTVMYSSGELHYESVEAPGFVVDEPTTGETDVYEVKSIRFTSTSTINSTSVFINFSTTKDKGYIVDNNVSHYSLDITDVYAKSIKNETLDVVTSVGNVIFGYEVLLRVETPNSVPLISAEPGTFNNNVVHFIIKDNY